MLKFLIGFFVGIFVGVLFTAILNSANDKIDELFK